MSAPEASSINCARALPPGSRLNGYVLQEVVGAGGFGVVYRARHLELGLEVAIKEYFPASIATRSMGKVQAINAESRPIYLEGLQRFENEAKALVELPPHPNIVSCHGCFQADGTAYLVMDLERGMPLSELLKCREEDQRPLNEEEMLAIVLPLLSGLRHVHEAGMLHRDVKPANVIICWTDQQPVLIDFGSAKQAVTEGTKSFAPYTDGYAAFEQVAEGPVGPWTDVYAVGALMWRIVAASCSSLASCHPIRIETRAMAAVNGLADPMPPAREVGLLRFREQVLDCIDQCLVVKKQGRVQSIPDLEARLSAVRASQPVRPKPSVGHGPERSILPAYPPSPAVDPVPASNRNAVKYLPLALTLALVSTWFIQSELDPVQTPPHATFTIDAEPAIAQVSLLNVSDPYTPGIRLPAGRYKISVVAAGFSRFDGEVEHGLEPTVRRVVLARQQGGSSAPRPPARSAPREARFIIRSNAVNASVKLLDPPGQYRAGMPLPLGEYLIEVSAPGFVARRLTVAHADDSPRVVELDREPAAPTPRRAGTLAESTPQAETGGPKSGSGAGIKRTDRSAVHRQYRSTR